MPVCQERPTGSKRSLLGIVGFAALPVWAGDAIPPLEIKSGLWEITSIVQMGDPPPLPPEVLARLPLAERSRVEAQARQRSADVPRVTVTRRCLDEKDRRAPSMFTFGEGQECRRTVLKASRTRQEIRVDCGPGLSQGGGTFRIEVLDSENVKVSSDWSAVDGSRTLNTSSTATLTWLGAACKLGSQAAPKAVAPTVIGPKVGSPKGAVPKEAPSPAAPATPAAPDAVYYYKLGREQTGRNNFQEALQSLNRAIELDPRGAPSYNARGYVYLRLQNYANAMADFTEAIRVRPDYANAYQNRAVARRHLGDEQGAAADSRTAAELQNPH